MQYLGSDDAGVSSFSLQDFEPSFGTKMNAAVRESWLESYGPVAVDLYKSKFGGDQGKRLTAAEALDYAKTNGGGVKLNLTPKDGQYTASQWATIVDRQRELAAVKDVRERTPWDMGSVLRGGAMFGAGIVDPINVATAFVPWTRLVGAARGLQAAVMAESFAARTGARAALGAIDAGISTAALEPFNYYARNELGDDYTAMDSMANIAFGTAFGGGLHVLGGAGSDAWKAYRARNAVTPAAITPELAAAAKTMTPEERVQAGIAPEAARAGMPEIVEPSRDPLAPLTAEEMAPYTGKTYNPTPTLNDVYTPAARQTPDSPVQPTPEPKPEKRRDLLDALKNNGGLAPSLARDAGGESGMRLNRKLPGVVKKTGLTEYDQVAEVLGEQGFLRPGTEAGSQDAIDQAQELVARAFNGESVMRWEDAITAAEKRQAMDYQDYLDSLRTNDAPAHEVAGILDPETREATLRASVAQAVDGRNVDVDAIVGMDESLQTHTTADAVAAADRNFSPSEVATADVDAAANVQARVDSAPKWDGVTEAEAALAEADTVLADTVKAGEDAFKYSRETEAQQRDLIVTHNLTAENLLHAKKMGGIAVPSLGITKKDTPLTGFGEITLIGDVNMADPKGYAGTKVFGADIYSPRYPSVSYEVTATQAKKLRADFAEGEKQTGYPLEMDEIGSRGKSQLTNSAAVMWTFLKEQGVEPDVKFTSGFSDARLQRLKEFGFEKYFGNTDHQTLMRDPEFQKIALNEWNDTHRVAGLEDEITTLEAMQADWNLNRAVTMKLAYDMGKVNEKPAPDKYATRDALRAQIRGDLSAKFSEYVDAKFEALGLKEKLFQGFNNYGDRKYTKHTLENVVKILKKELRGGENFSYGVGSLRAKFTPQFKSVADIRKNKGRLVDKAAFEQIKKEVDDELVSIADDLGLSLDQTIEVMEDAPKMGATRAIERAMKDYKRGASFSDGAPQQVAEFLTKLKNLPTEYFEAKILRDVSPAEFKGAVVPDNIDPRAMEYLKQNVEDIRTYKAGDEASRAQAIQTFENLMFSRSDAGMTGKSTPEALLESVRATFGKSTDAMLESGRIKVVGAVDEIPGGPHPQDVKGATAPDGTVYIVAENVSEAEARGMVLHEVGVHAGMENMLGKDVFDSVLAELDDAIARGESWAQAARDRVPSATLPEHIREEQLAYLVQNSPELPLVQRIIAAVRAWAYRTFEFAREGMTLTEADFRAMAVAALHDVAREGGSRAGFAYGRDAVQTATAAFKKWFGDWQDPLAFSSKRDKNKTPVSQAVNDDGTPMVMYHSTNADFSRFESGRTTTNETTFGPMDTQRHGIFISPDVKFSEEYLRGKDGANVMPVYVNVKAPADMTDGIPGDVISDIVENSSLTRADFYGIQRGNEWEIFDGDFGRQVVDALKAAGYDGAILKELDRARENEFTTWVAFNPEQIKSATGNNGAFDPANPDIRYSRGETPDPSTTADELKPYDDAIARAKQYASVLRAAADKLDNDAQATSAMRAAMPDITPQEINDLLGGLRKQVKGLRGMARTARTAVTAENTATMMQSDAMKAADTLANNLSMAAVIEKRNAALNINARMKASAYINQFRAAGLDFEGFRGLLVGTERKRAGGRISVDAEQKNFRGEWLGGMIADLEQSGLMKAFASGEFDRDVYVALYNLGRDGKGNENLPPEAVKIAEVVNKYQTDARNTRNRFGAWIRDLNGYITRQSHDMLKIRDAGEGKYKQDVLPLLDVERSMRDFDGSVDDFLTRVYDDFAAGSHMKAAAGEDDIQALGRGSSLAKKESQSRVLYFKDGAAAYEYNQKYGQGRLAESVLQGLDHAAKSAGLLKLLGTNPEATVTRLFDEYAESLRGDPERRAKFLSYRKELDNLLSHVDGSVNIPGNVTAAKISSFARSWISMAKLGGMLLSSVTDLANYAAELRFAQDSNLLSGTLDGIGSLAKGRSAGEKRAILNSLGVFHESTLGAVFHRFDSPDLIGGKTSAAMQAFFKLSGINWWTESLRDGYALTHAAYMSSQAGKTFDKIDASLRDMLGLYNIDAGKWEILRQANTHQADGRTYITPDGLRTVPRKTLEAYITSVGRTVNDAAVQNLRDDLSAALRTMTIDRMHHAVIEPNARTRAFMLRGTQPGTVPGELLRFVTQFKSFPVALVQGTLGREVYGRGYDTLGQYLKNGKGDMLGLASFIALSTAMGYAAMSAKDLLRGKNPRPIDDWRTWQAAMVQGGGLGIYGDFLFGKYNRMGGTLSGSLMGPMAGVVDTAADLWTRIRNGDDVAAASFKALLDNTPFMNLFYTRAALDYLILFQIQEALNPGFLRRMERRAQTENGQTYFLPPTAVVN